jgi:hypothetical protein
MAIVGHGGQSKYKRPKGKTTALIEVQKTVALDMSERQVKKSGDITEKTKLAVSTEQKSMVQVKEGEVSVSHTKYFTRCWINLVCSFILSIEM